MTRTHLLLSNVLLVVLLAVGLGACSDDEQQAALREKQLTEQREAKEQAEKEAKQVQQVVQPQATTTPEPEQTPEVPAEPEKVDNYVLVDGIVCRCMRIDPCGVYLWNCDRGIQLACFHDVKMRVVSVDKTESNDGNCN